MLANVGLLRTFSVTEIEKNSQGGWGLVANSDE